MNLIHAACGASERPGTLASNPTHAAARHCCVLRDRFRARTQQILPGAGSCLQDGDAPAVAHGLANDQVGVSGAGRCREDTESPAMDDWEPSVKRLKKLRSHSAWTGAAKLSGK